MPRPPPGGLPDPGIKPTSLMSPALATSSLPLVPPGKPTTEYYSATKNKIMPLAETWMQLGIIILSEVSQKKTNTVSLICKI